MAKQKEIKLTQNLAAAMPPGQYVYHPACHCSRCLDKRQATSIWGQFRMILKKKKIQPEVASVKPQAASVKQQALDKPGI